MIAFVATLLWGLLFLASSLVTRAGLHNDVNSIFVFVWLVFGLAATYVSRSVWPGPWLPRAKVLARRLPVAVVAAGWVLGLAIIFGPPNDPHALDVRRQHWCHDRLDQLGMSITMYADNHGGQYPDRPESLLLDGVGPAAFVCPSTADEPADGATPKDKADALASGGHLSYIYVGRGLTTATTRPDTVVFYESIRNHTRDNPGFHVLYAGERLEYLQGEAAVQFLVDRRGAALPTSRPAAIHWPGGTVR